MNPGDRLASDGHDGAAAISDTTSTHSEVKTLEIGTVVAEPLVDEFVTDAQGSELPEQGALPVPTSVVETRPDPGSYDHLKADGDYGDPTEGDAMPLEGHVRVERDRQFADSAHTISVRGQTGPVANLDVQSSAGG
jgi:hypothetical protein